MAPVFFVTNMPATPLPKCVGRLPPNGVSDAFRRIGIGGGKFYSLAQRSRDPKRVAKCSHRMENDNLRQAIPPWDGLCGYDNICMVARSIYPFLSRIF